MPSSANALKDQLPVTFLKAPVVLGSSLARAFQMILAFPPLLLSDVAAFKQTADVVIGVDLADIYHNLVT